jgi:PAS domain S-box-containing protein
VPRSVEDDQKWSGSIFDVDLTVTSSAFSPAALLSAVIEMSDDAMFTCDVHGRVITWSATAQRLFGRSDADAIGRPLDVLFPGHVSGEVQSVLATVLAGDRIRHFESEVVRPDGMPLPVSLSLCPVPDDQGTAIGSVVIVRDVTEQRLAQATLAEVDARMAEGEALAHIGSWLWDLRTGAVQWSAEFHRIHGVDPSEFAGTLESYLAVVHPDDRDVLRAAMVESVELGRPFNGEYRVIRPGRAAHVIQVRAQPTFGSTGAAVGLRGIGHDITTGNGARVSRERPDA